MGCIAVGDQLFATMLKADRRPLVAES